MLLAFLPVAALLTVTPGVSTALVVRSAVTDGRAAALRTTVGNALGVLAWALLAAIGIAALVATSVIAFTVVKLIGAAVLIAMGLRALLRGERPPRPAPARRRAALRDGLTTSLANPKLAVFFVALFPQFVPDGVPVLPAAMLMATVIVVLDLVWYSLLAYLVARAKRAFVEGPWMK